MKMIPIIEGLGVDHGGGWYQHMRTDGNIDGYSWPPIRWETSVE